MIVARSQLSIETRPPPLSGKNHPGLIEYTLKNEPVIPREACGAISRTVAGIIVHWYK